MNTTALLKKSIAYERSKSDLTNLLNHNVNDLSILIDAIELSMRDYQSEINIREVVIEQAEDMSDKVRANLDDAITWRKNQIQSLLAWRAIVFSAIDTVNKKSI